MEIVISRKKFYSFVIGFLVILVSLLIFWARTSKNTGNAPEEPETLVLAQLGTDEIDSVYLPPPISDELFAAFAFSSSAKKYNINNYIPEYLIPNAERYIRHVILPALEKFGEKLQINSGYRNERVNALVGGVKTSAHLLALASDLTIKKVEEREQLVDFLTQLEEIDQIIIYLDEKKEIRFVHCGLAADGKKPRNQVFFK